MAELDYPASVPLGSSPVTVVDKFKDTIFLECTLTADTSMTIAELLEVALPVKIAGITIQSTDVRYNPAVGDATAANGTLAAVQTIPGGVVQLTLATFYAAAESTMQILVFEAYDSN
jgi:hypothetical protein